MINTAQSSAVKSTSQSPSKSLYRGVGGQPAGAGSQHQGSQILSARSLTTSPAAFLVTNGVKPVGPPLAPDGASVRGTESPSRRGPTFKDSEMALKAPYVSGQASKSTQPRGNNKVVS